MPPSMAPLGFSESLADVDVSFARSGRRSATRRRRSIRQTAAAWTVVGAVGVLAVGLVGARALGGLSAASEPAAGGDAAAAGQPAAAVRPAADMGPSTASCPVPERFREAFAAASRRTDVPMPLLVAVAYEESNMRQEAQSSAGARGLLQLMPATAHELELNPELPFANLLAGAHYLDRMIAEFGDLELALAAYNSGPAAVRRAGTTVPPATAGYVAAVMERAAALDGC